MSDDETITPTSWFERTTAAAAALGLRFTQYRRREGVTFELYLLPPGGVAVTTLFTTTRRAEVDAFVLGFRLGSVRPE